MSPRTGETTHDHDHDHTKPTDSHMTPHRFEHDELAKRIANAKAILCVPIPQYDGEPEVTPDKHYEVLSAEPWEGYFIPIRVQWAHGPEDDFTDRMHSLDLRDVAIETVGDR